MKGPNGRAFHLWPPPEPRDTVFYLLSAGWVLVKTTLIFLPFQSSLNLGLCPSFTIYLIPGYLGSYLNILKIVSKLFYLLVCFLSLCLCYLVPAWDHWEKSWGSELIATRQTLPTMGHVVMSPKVIEKTLSIWVCAGCSGVAVKKQGFGLDWVLLGSGGNGWF